MAEFKRFELADTGIVGTGVYTGCYWNGWDCPLFTFEESMRLIDALNSSEIVQGSFHYDNTRDSFIETEDGEPVAEWYGFYSLEYGLHLYQVGCGYIWRVVE